MIKEIRYTHQFRNAIHPARLGIFENMLKETLTYFPELEGDCVNVGVTRAFGYAAFAMTSDRSRIKIRYNPAAKLSYHLLGHELTHFVQRLGTIPSGETQCDIWTLARHPIFCDEPPAYLRIPHAVEDAWKDHSATIRQLCIEAITERRYGRRKYIVWLEAHIRGIDCIGDLKQCQNARSQ
jgi:hypothetical protein